MDHAKFWSVDAHLFIDDSRDEQSVTAELTNGVDLQLGNTESESGNRNAKDAGLRCGKGELVPIYRLAIVVSGQLAHRGYALEGHVAEGDLAQLFYEGRRLFFAVECESEMASSDWSHKVHREDAATVALQETYENDWPRTDKHGHVAPGIKR